MLGLRFRFKSLVTRLSLVPRLCPERNALTLVPRLCLERNALEAPPLTRSTVQAAGSQAEPANQRCKAREIENLHKKEY